MIKGENNENYTDTKFQIFVKIFHTNNGENFGKPHKH